MVVGVLMAGPGGFGASGGVARQFYTLRAALFDDPTTATIVQQGGRNIKRSRGPELSID